MSQKRPSKGKRQSLPDLYHQIGLWDGPNGYRLRSALARAIAAGANPIVANAEYRTARVTVIKAVRRG